MSSEVLRCPACRSVQVDASEDDLPLVALADADEAFLTSTTREVQPVRAVDGRVLSAAPGTRTKEAADAFTALVRREIDP